MARNRDGDLPPHLTELFHRYVRARDAGHAVDLEELLREAGDRAPELRARVDGYEAVERASALLARPGPNGPGGRLGRFELVRLLGSGGLAEVYLARDPKLGRRVALKVLDRKVALDEEGRRWVLREARSLARVEHPNVLRVFEVTEEDGALLVVAEHLSGPSLAEVIAEMRRARDGGGSAPLADAEAEARRRAAVRLGEELAPFTRRVAVLQALADALATCHDNGILHRDVKPGNVVFGAGGTPKLLDFGLAHLEDAEEDTSLDITVRMMGTPAYLAPEQVDGGRTGADPRSDLFSLGTLAYELLTLEQPFHRETRSKTLDAVSLCRPRRLRAVDPAVPVDLERVVLHALERRPNDRYQEVAALAADLRAFAEHRQVSVAEPRLGHALRLWVHRNRRAVAVAAVTLALLVAALSASWLATARRARTAVTDALAELRPEELSKPAEFIDALDRLLVQRAAAARFDASSLRRAALGAVSPEVEARVDRVLARIAAALDAELAPDPTGVTTAMFQPWSRVVELADRLNPGSGHLDSYRDQGKVVFPADEEHGIRGELYRWFPASDESFPLLEPIAVCREVLLTPVLDPGFYRYVAWTAQGARIAFEHEFMLNPGWNAPLRIEPRARDEAILASALLYPRTRLDMREFGATDEPLDAYLARREDPRFPPPPPVEDPIHVTVPAFRLAPRLVTCGEYAAFLEDRGIAPRYELNLRDLAAPVRVSHAEAVEYCAWHGGRLPTSYELRVHADAYPDGEWVERLAGAEWVGETTKDMVPGEANAVRYLTFLAEEQQSPLFWFLTRSHDMEAPSVLSKTLKSGESIRVGIGFRLAYTDDVPEGLREAGRIRRD